MKRGDVLVPLLILGFALACGSEDTDGSPRPLGSAGAAGAASSCALAASESYDASDWDANVSVEADAIQRFKAFLQPMKDAEADPSVKPKAADLKALFDAGSPSLRSLTTPHYAARVDVWLDEFENAAGNSWKPAEPPSGEGGIYGSWIFDERGTDLRQVIEKGMFSATHYASAASLAAVTHDARTVDRMLALFGAHPSFPQDDKHPTTPDQFSAQYAKRRDDKSSSTPGLYRQLKAAFITARTAALAGPNCSAELDAAISAILSTWEKALMGTIVYYVNDAMKKLAVDPPSDKEFAAGLHGLGEATGFVQGFRQIEAAHKKITDAEVDELSTLLNAEASASVNTYKFVTDASAELPKLSQAIRKIQDIYGFSDAEIEAFKVNY